VAFVKAAEGFCPAAPCRVGEHRLLCMAWKLGGKMAVYVDEAADLPMLRQVARIRPVML